MKLYVIHEGFVRSKNDGDTHFISFPVLCQLYNIDPQYCIKWTKDKLWKDWEDLIHLYPDYSGNYKIPNIEEEK